MTSIQLFNNLNGKEVSRNYLEEILQQAKTENQTPVIYRISKILNDYPDVEHFEMNIVQYSQGLAGAMHTGDYREALDDCGRLRKGWKFVKGNVVKVEKKEKKEVSKPKKQVTKTEKKATETEKECKTCGNTESKQNSVEKSSNDLILADNQPTKLNILLSSTEKENQSAKDIQNIFDKKLSKMLRLRSGFINTNEFDFKAPKTSKKGIESFEKIVIKDELRPALTGVLIEKEVYVGTDAHKLLVIERTKNDGLKTGKIYDVNARYINYLNVFKNIDDALSEKEWDDERYIDAVFPNYETVFPKQYRWKTPFVDIEPILNHAYKAYYLLKFDVQKEDSYTIPFRIGKLDIYISALKLFESLQCLYVNGTKQVSFECVAYNKPITIKSKENKNVALLMPVIVEKKSDLNVNQVQISATENKDFKESQGLAAPQLDFFKNLKEAKKYFLDWALKNLRGKKVYHKELEKWVIFNRKGIEHTLSNRISLEKMTLILQAEKMLKNSHLIKFEEENKGRENIKGVYRMRSVGVVNDEEREVIITLREGENGVIYYDHKVEIENPLPTRKSEARPENLLGNGFSQDKSTKKSVSSKKTDENFGLAAPQPELSTDDFKNMKVSELRKFTLEYYNTHLKGKTTVIKKYLKEVVFTTKAGKKIANGEAMYSAKAVAVKHLEQLIKNSSYNNWGDRKITDSKDVIGYMNFKSKLIIDGEKRHLRIALAVYKNRKTELKSIEVGKRKKSLQSAQEPVATLQDGQIETISEHKNTKKSVSGKKTDENFGLGLLLTDEIRKKAFTDKGKLRKGWYYEENGILTNGKYFYIPKDKKQIEYQLLKEKVLDKISQKQKIKSELNDLESDAKWKNDYKLNWLNNGYSRIDFYQSLLPKLKERISNIEKEDIWEIVENSVADGKNGNRVFTWNGKKSKEHQTFLERFGIKDEKAYLLNEDALFVYHFVKEAIKKEISKVRGDREKLEKKYGLAAPVPVVETIQEPTLAEAHRPQVFVEEFTETSQVQPEPVNSLPAETNHRKGSLIDKLATQPTDWDFFQIDEPQMSQFLGKVERKTKDSLVITLTGGQGSGKTRFAFQFINALGQRYKVGHISIEEHPESFLYDEKIHQYLNRQAQGNTLAFDVRSISELDKIIRENEVIVIDSFQKLRELDRKFEVDKDLRKKYDGKLFLVIYQQTTDGKMKGGSSSQYDGDIILFTEKFANYQENYVYPDKNRYNHIPADQLKYNIFQQRLLPVETEEQTTENQVYDVIY
ncbi:LPD3 domain-containing protein [Capnocytophaga felis]|uniref:Large polyvalent protein-associated domain-containing protein n=1 Tax=Capnocytophaga felis TaxID=2267611 RepID=A0A5M4BCA9_9FLAO|nr:hypothetical protein [Capnocytophaga felis]GET46897.1 hypothetical protein RCZ01_21990 [Capnocytophaga felis]GET48599.1 hypothetical protein RCZ02_14300 [Capnocytophaga felis]